MVESLIHKGADVHSTAVNGDTVLHLAIARYFAPICLYLVNRFIKAGCNPTACNSEGKTVFHIAIEYGDTSVMEYLLLCNVAFPPDILPIALQNHSTLHIVESLIRKGANVNSTTSDGDTVLHLAVAKYPASTCLYLVKRFVNAGCNPTTRNSMGKTVFEGAVERGYALVAEYLLLRNGQFRAGI